MAVDISVNFQRPPDPQPLFNLATAVNSPRTRLGKYADGKRFLTVQPQQTAGEPQIT
jgi:hypothetical protein